MSDVECKSISCYVIISSFKAKHESKLVWQASVINPTYEMDFKNTWVFW